MAFLESPRFPDEIAAWAVGGRGFKTTVVETYGGNEFRDAAWTQMRGEWEVQEALRSGNPGSAYYLKAFVAFFRTVFGQLYAFRFKDYQDYTDGGAGIFQAIDATHFQMYKQYSNSPLTFNAIIQKPVSATVVVTGGVSPSVDYTTGIVTVASGTPTSWTGQYDVPCRFAQDIPGMGLDPSTGALWSWQQLKVIEVRDIS